MKCNEWNILWKKYPDIIFFGKPYARFLERSTIKILKEIRIKKNAKIIDMGVGQGRTLLNFVKNGYKNSIGIDFSEASIQLCRQKNLNVELMNAVKTDFEDNEFDLVFSDGLIEHFSDFVPLAKEMARISKKYILLSQPKNNPILNKIRFHGRNPIPKDYNYSVDDFKKGWEGADCKLILKKDAILNWLLLFMKNGADSDLESK
jgi:ubiquinone/menaquinone biosynthesis C-methylase UbiE